MNATTPQFSSHSTLSSWGQHGKSTLCKVGTSGFGDVEKKRQQDVPQTLECCSGASLARRWQTSAMMQRVTHVEELYYFNKLALQLHSEAAVRKG